MTERPAQTPRLYLIRHGETDWSLSGRHTGRTDLPLTPAGEAAARDLAPWLRDVGFVAVLTSPRRRAVDTCSLAGLAAAAEVEADLAEWDYGAYEGLRSRDIRRTRPDWDVFRDGCPDGETPVQIYDRADRVIVRACALRGPVALFSHGQFGAALAARWIGLSVVEGRHFSLSPASLSILAVNPNHGDARVIDLWNATPRQR